MVDKRVRRLAAVLLALAAAPGLPAQEKPLPLDPLTEREREVAAGVAREDRRVREFLGSGRNRQIYLDFISVKRDGREDEPSRRHAEALFYNYDRNLGLRALIDLESRSVVDVARVNGESVPINVEEVEEAARLALANTRVVGLFGGEMPRFNVAKRPATRAEAHANRIEGLRTVDPSPSGRCHRHRCVVLFFRVDNRYVQMNRVSVDLTTRTVQILGGER